MITDKEFLMTDADFAFISKTVYRECGIVLSEQKQDMVYSRLTRRIRELGLKNFAEYIRYLTENKDKELTEFINSLTTNLTSFFREPHHFDFLNTKLIPELTQIHKSDKRVRIWSAGCSTGMEPYSIAKTIFNKFPRSYDVKILATDLDTQVLEKAKNAVYELQTITGVEPVDFSKMFVTNDTADKYRIKQRIRDLVTFKQLNLLSDWPMSGPMDVVFCRNVVIYFDLETKNQLFERFADILRPNGYLILGHSETMSRDVHRFKALGNTIYQKVV